MEFWKSAHSTDICQQGILPYLEVYLPLRGQQPTLNMAQVSDLGVRVGERSYIFSLLYFQNEHGAGPSSNSPCPKKTSTVSFSFSPGPSATTVIGSKGEQVSTVKQSLICCQKHLCPGDLASLHCPDAVIYICANQTQNAPMTQL